MKTYRQGDVFLVEVKSFPDGLKEKDKILAYGEVSGHHHRFDNGNKQVLVFADDERQQFVQVNKKSTLIHEEHQNLEIPKGKYKVVMQREYDLLSDHIRQVLD